MQTRQNHQRHKQDLSDWAPVVILGNGIAGMTAALEARRLAPDLPITLITKQNHPTIHTPALKQFCMRAIEREQLLAFPQGTERNASLSMIHAEVVRLNTIEKCLHFASGQSYGYESLLLATGSTPQHLPASMPGYDLDGVITLHRLRDYLDLERRLRTGEVQTVVVIGGGVHASETVTSLLRLQVKVHWILRGNIFYSRMLDTRASAIALDHFQQAGAEISLETEVRGIVGHIGTVRGVVTTKHSFLPCDLVLVCIGNKPASELIDQCEQLCDETSPPASNERGGENQKMQRHGLVVDEHLQTQIPEIFAAGDIAALPNPLTGKHEVRAHWASAVEQGQVAGAMLAKQSEQVKGSFGVSWHMTAIGDLFLLTVGMPLLTEGAESLVNLSHGDYRRITIAHNRLIGYLSLSRNQIDGLGVKRLIEDGVDRTEIEEMLLNGTFDAHTYYTQQHVAQVLDLPEQSAQTSLRGSVVSQTEEESAAQMESPSPISLASLPGNPGKSIVPHKPWPQIVKEVNACIGCNECLLACPALAEPLSIDVLNRETLSGPTSDAVIRFTRSCYQCGACVDPCPVGLRSEAEREEVRSARY
jgi:NAD(P)H-nitrite reductase large subunit/ferredoxin